MSPRAKEPSERVESILELPSTLAEGRYGVSRQAIIGVAVVVAVALAVLAGRYHLAREEAAPDPVAVEEAGETAGGTAGEEPGEEAPAAGGVATEAPTAVTVHVVGEVRRPGVVTLPAGSRVSTALDEAGGETGEADLTGVNLARPLVDGEQVHVPRPGETPPAAAAPPGAPAAPGAPAGEAGAPVNLNTADLTTLESLPGVGPVLAQRILDWRTEHGRFTAVEELGEVSGIGDKIYAQLEPKVAV